MIRFAAILAATSLLGFVALAQEHVPIHDLGTLEGYASSEANGLSDTGFVAGVAFTEDGDDFSSHAFLWHDNEMQDLGTLGGKNSWAVDVNSDGQVVGDAETAEGNPHAFLWRDGEMTDLGTLGGPTSQAIRVNASGQVVGLSDTAEGEDAPFHAFLWHDGGMTDLGTLGGRDSRANGINDRGQVVGRARDEGGVWRAFLWENGEMTDLGTLPGFAAGVAIRINESAQVVGWAETESGGRGPVRPVLWEDGATTDLGTLGGEQGRAFGINDAGQVVGRGQDADGAARAFLWQGGEMTDLNSLVDPALGWVLESAYAINNEGQIAGYGTLNGEGRAFLLTLPEDIDVAVTAPGGEAPTRSIATDEDGVRTTSPTHGYDARVDPQTNEVVARVRVGGEPFGVAIDEQGVWVARTGD